MGDPDGTPVDMALTKKIRGQMNTAGRDQDPREEDPKELVKVVLGTPVIQDIDTVVFSGHLSGNEILRSLNVHIVRNLYNPGGVLCNENLILIEFAGFDPVNLIKHMAKLADRSGRSLVSDLGLILCVICARGTKLDSAMKRMSAEGMESISHLKGVYNIKSGGTSARAPLDVTLNRIASCFPLPILLATVCGDAKTISDLPWPSKIFGCAQFPALLKRQFLKDHT